jgi:hypothetical protein
MYVIIDGTTLLVLLHQQLYEAKPLICPGGVLSVSLTSRTSLKESSKESSKLRSLGKIPRPARRLLDKTDYLRSIQQPAATKVLPQL